MLPTMTVRTLRIGDRVSVPGGKVGTVESVDSTPLLTTFSVRLDDGTTRNVPAQYLTRLSVR